MSTHGNARADRSDVRTTAYTIVDVTTGAPLCHSARQRKAAMNSSQKRTAREGFDAMCRAAGVVDAGGWWTCTETGRKARRNGEHRAGETHVIDAGHVIPDERDGAYCPCNLVPQYRLANLAAEREGNRSLDADGFAMPDPRDVWREVWLREYASPSKARRAGF